MRYKKTQKSKRSVFKIMQCDSCGVSFQLPKDSPRWRCKCCLKGKLQKLQKNMGIRCHKDNSPLLKPLYREVYKKRDETVTPHLTLEFVTRGVCPSCHYRHGHLIRYWQDDAEGHP